MKKLNKLVLMAIVGLSSLFVGAQVFAAGAFDMKSQELICDPEAIDPGGKADCYIIGHEMEASHVSHGVIVQFYTSDKLSIDGVAVVSEKIASSTGAHIFRNGDPTTAGSSLNAVDGVKNFSCTVAILPAGDVRDSGCAVFYTAGTDATATGKFTRGNLTIPTSATKELADRFGSDEDLVVLGKLVVKLDADNQVEDCGEICWKTWSVPTANLYEKYVHCSEAGSSDPDCGDTPIPSSEEECQDLKMNVGTPENTITGSFVSYTILAAGILLAISAVAIAKKNNRLQKI